MVHKTLFIQRWVGAIYIIYSEVIEINKDLNFFELINFLVKTSSTYLDLGKNNLTYQAAELLTSDAHAWDHIKQLYLSKVRDK